MITYTEIDRGWLTDGKTGDNRSCRGRSSVGAMGSESGGRRGPGSCTGWPVLGDYGSAACIEEPTGHVQDSDQGEGGRKDSAQCDGER